MDRRLYLDVNRFATRTAWAHGVIAFFARPSALVILAVLLLVALARARVAGLGGTDLDQIAALVWVALGTGLAYAVSLPVVHLVARARPFVAMPQVTVLITRPTGFGFPNEHTVIAGAFAAGLWLSRTRLMGAVATLIAILVALAVVYTGIAYPGDAVVGLLLGVLVSVALYPFVIGSLQEMVHAVARSPLKVLVGGARHKGPLGPGPAAHPKPTAESGTVRILAPDEARAVRLLPPDKSRRVRILPSAENDAAHILPPGEMGTGSGADKARN